jgi:hypothetical protein
MDDIAKTVLPKLGRVPVDSITDQYNRTKMASRESLDAPQTTRFRFINSHVCCVMCNTVKSMDEIFFSQSIYWPRTLFSALCVDCISQSK